MIRRARGRGAQPCWTYQGLRAHSGAGRRGEPLKGLGLEGQCDQLCVSWVGGASQADVRGTSWEAVVQAGDGDCLVGGWGEAAAFCHSDRFPEVLRGQGVRNDTQDSGLSTGWLVVAVPDRGSSGGQAGREEALVFEFKLLW